MARNYLNSPTDYSAPMRPAPVPTQTFSQRNGPNGPSSVATYSGPVEPQQPDADLPSERRMRLTNEGIIPRGPSSPMAPAMRPGPMMPMPLSSPAPSPNLGTSVSGAVAPTPAQPTYNKAKHGLLTGIYDRADKALAREAKNADPMSGAPRNPAAMKAAQDAHDAARKQLDDYEKSFLQPATQPTSPAPSGYAQPAGPAPVPSPYDNPNTGAPQMLPPIKTGAQNLEETRSSPGYQDRLREAYATAGADLAQNPQLGTTSPQHSPLPPLSVPPSGVGNSRGEYAQAADTARRNQASIARVNQAGDDKVNNANAAQIAQNQQASQNIAQRLGPGAAAPPVAQAPVTPPVARQSQMVGVDGNPPQAAQAAAPTSQPTQITQVDNEQHYQSLPAGAQFVWQGKVYTKGK